MKRLLLVTLVAALAAPAAAQNRTLTARTLCFSYVQDVKSVWVPGGSEEGMTEVGLFTAVHSLPFQMRTTEGKAVFFKPSEDSETPYEPIATTSIPDSPAVLFLFLPSGQQNQPYRVVSLADDKRNFPYGSVRLMNLSTAQVRIHLGEHSGPKAVALAPGKSFLVPKVSRVDGFNRYPVLAEFRTDKGFARFHHTAWQAIEGKRDLAIVFNDPQSGRPRIRHYEDAEPAQLDADL